MTNKINKQLRNIQSEGLEKLKIECAVRRFEGIWLVHYFYPVNNLKTFDEKVFEKMGEKFFNK